ncbi:MAG: Ig-like domain-containing protein, partial [Microcystaceae cyanobacterium]
VNSAWPTVEALPAPQLPAWIEQVSPLGDSVEPRSQILVRFKEPLIPLEALDSPQQRSLLDKLEIKPSLPGQFRFLTPQMIGFQSDKALPKATRLQITLKSGLQDLKQHRLDQDIAWTFSTENIQLKDLPGVVEGDKSTPEIIKLNPTLSFQSNVELDLDSLRTQTKLIPEGKTETTALKIDRKLPATENNTNNNQNAQAEFDPSQPSWKYSLQPRFDLEKGTNYRLEIGKGLRPAQGNLATLNPISTTVKTYGDLAYDRLEAYGLPDGGGAYGRFVKGSPQLKFNNPLQAKSVTASVTIKPEPKKGVKAVRAFDEDNYISVNPWALEPNTNYEITVNEKLTDKFGQTLAKPVKISYDTGKISPDLWAPSGLNIFPENLSQTLRLNLSTVNLPQKDYLAAYRVIEPTDLVFTDSAYPNGTDKDLLPNVKTWQSYSIEQKENQTIETAIPLQAKLGQQTGMIAYGFRAKTNQYLENGKKAWREPEFYGLIQLTNLGIFAQSFPESGLVRVNHLNDGSAVANAQIEIYRS